ncbi:hypothetical protein OSB04_001531 [Centaurea solstitialis]|uniref:Protein FAR1-RELATED SEQUENCE n=1 Tax=Centaurea solstitialis TaxID=347529 RepID=A0AA38WSQ8_9ASTR|nr:hypothetical protein OSB04_001531 [Centaurea solstitialis]
MATWNDDFQFFGDFNAEAYDIHTNQATQSEYLHFYLNSNDEMYNIYTNQTIQDDDRPASKFSTDMMFKSHEDLIDWVKKLGRSLGYIIVIKRSKKKRGVMSKVILICDRGGKYRGKYPSLNGCWTLTVRCEKHNHEPAEDMEGHPYAMRLTENEVRLVEDLSRKNVKPRDILSTLKEQNPDNVSTLRTIYNARQKISATEHKGVLDYLNEIWLKPYREMFVSVWTDIFPNFGNHTTNRVESQHSKLKLYLDSNQATLRVFLSDIHQLIHSQHTSIKASFQQSKTVVKHRYDKPQFCQLHGFVSLHALELIFKEFKRSKDHGLVSGNCRCQMRTCYGLPCAHEHAYYFNAGQSIPLESIDGFWRKLDLSPCISVEDDDICCDDDVQMFTENFKKQPRSMKSSFLRKLREIFVPWTTQVQDVKGDGNCGFRAIAKTEYLEVYGVETWHQVYNSLNFFELDTFAPNEHWMDVFETGLLIASRYNVILHSLTTVGSMTFFPLRSSPPPWYEHVAFTIGYVNGNHHVKISIADGHPMPPIVPNWFRFKYDCATAWATPYMTHIDKFKQLLSSNCITDFLSVD